VRHPAILSTLPGFLLDPIPQNPFIPRPARHHRRVLFWAMAEQGFTAYTEEWWHFDLGDQFWGQVRGCAAHYAGADAPV